MSEQSFTDSALAEHIKGFLNRRKDADGNYKYVEMIDEMMPRASKHIIIDYNDLYDIPEVQEVFTKAPITAFDTFSRAVKEALQVRHPGYAHSIEKEIRIRLSNYPAEKSLREIDVTTIGKIISVSGMVVRASEVKPLAEEAVYVCKDGHTTKTGKTKGMDIKIPVICDNTNCKERNFELDPENTKFVNFQILRMQELPEDLPPGQMPHYIDVIVKQDLVDNARPGDRIMLTGIARVEQEAVSGVNRGQSRVCRLQIDGNNIEFLGGKGKTSKKTKRDELSPEDEKRIKDLANNPKIYQKLIDSFAPHIQGQTLIKEAILLLMVGANQRTHRDDISRGDINVFLVGDPGTAKSEMLKFCSKIAPRGLYTSGRGSTAAGLTAAVTKDKSGIMMLEAGAVVLGDQGLVCIDEFDKMRAEDRSALHEVMEQQSVSIAKGGIVATLNARTSILAAANPIRGKYDPYKTIYENADLPIPLLTRFDLIFIVRDIVTRERDDLIIDHIMQRNRKQDHNANIIDANLLTKYLTYAKYRTPELTGEAEARIRAFYHTMRNVESDGMITVTPRQAEGIIRLATARAKLLMKDKVDEEDADRAILLTMTMLEDAGVDADPGEADYSVLQTKEEAPSPPQTKDLPKICLLYTSPSPRDRQKSRMPSSA